MTLADILGFIDKPSDYTIEVDGHEVALLDEYGMSCGSNAEWFVCGHEFGATHIIHASSYSDAWDAWIDELPTIPEEELIEAYAPSNESGSFLDEAIDAYPGRGEGRWTDDDWATIKANAKRALDAMVEAASGPQGTGDYPEIVEGYEMQSNCSGTGIVDVGHYAWMNEADLSKVTIARKVAK
jgi:hypothetical protein